MMWDFSISRSLGLMGRTMPFILLRIAVYFGMAAAYVIATGTGAGIGWGVGAFGDDGFRAGSIFWGGAIGFGLTAGVLYLLREYILYIQGGPYRRARRTARRQTDARWQVAGFPRDGSGQAAVW